jgi:hypothetical protein
MRAEEAGEDTTELSARIEDVEAQIEFARNKSGRTGTASSHALLIRKLEVREDYSIVELKRRGEALKGAPLTEEEVKDLEAKALRIQELEALLEEERIRASKAEAKAEAALAKRRIREERVAGRKKRNKADQKRLKELYKETAILLNRVSSQGFLNPELHANLVKIAAIHIKVGTRSFANFSEEVIATVGEKVRPFLQDAWDEARKESRDEITDKVLTKIEEEGSVWDARHALQKLARSFVDENLEITRDELVDAVHQHLEDAGITAERAEVSDAVSGYGDYRLLKKDDVSVRIRDLKGQLQQVGKIRDMLEKGVAGKKSGVEQRERSKEERDLIREANRIQREEGIETVDEETQIKSVLASIKTRMRNIIADLEEQMALGEPRKKAKRRPPSDAESKALEAKLADARKRYDALFGRPELTEAQRAERAIKALMRSINELDRRIKEGDLAPKKGKPLPSNPHLTAARARRNALRAELKALRDAQKPKRSAEEIAMQRKETRLRNELARARERLAAGDFAPKKKPAPVALTEKAVDYQVELEEVRRDIRRGEIEWKRANRTIGQRFVEDVLLGTSDFMRTINSAFDASAVGRQAAVLTVRDAFVRPVELAGRIGKMFKAISRDEALRMQVEIMNDPYAQEMESLRPGIFSQFEGNDLTSLEEEMRSRAANKIMGVKASARMFATYLNLARLSHYKRLVGGMSESLAESGDTQLVERGKTAFVDLVGQATGRGHMGSAQRIVNLAGIVLWAPRFLASRAQFLSGYTLIKAPKEVRGQIAREYAATIGSYAAMYGLFEMVKELLGLDDDELDIEYDWRSSDFLKIRVGDTRVDPTGGLASIFTLVGRKAPFGLGGIKSTRTGEITPIRGEDIPYGRRTSNDLTYDFLRYKLHPMAGLIMDLDRGFDFNRDPVRLRVTEGLPAAVEDLKGLSKQVIVPIAVEEVYEAMEHEGYAKGTALGILSIFGFSTQIHNDQTSTSSSRGGRPASTRR